VALRDSSASLTSYAGLELFREFTQRLDLAGRLRRHAGRVAPSSDFGAVSVLLMLIALIVIGGRRIRHLRFVKHDPIVQRFCGLSRLPSERSVGRWLAGWNKGDVDALLRVNHELVAERIREAGIRRLTIDVDGSVVSTGQQVAWAQRGFNPHRRKVPSYYPITAYEAQTGQILRLKNRPGNVCDGKAVPFLRELLDQLEADLGTGYRVEFRMDGAFFRDDVLSLLQRRRAEYAIKMPFYLWTGAREQVAKQTRWTRIDDEIAFFETRLDLTPWARAERVLIFRRRVGHKTAKNYQLDLFDPSNGHFEYSAVVTNKPLRGAALWYFMCGRGVHEKVYGELKNGFAFDSVPSMSYGGNSVWQALSVLSFNLTRAFQVAAGAERRTRNRKRRTLFRLASIHTLRFELLHRAAALVRPAGRATLDVGDHPALKDRLEVIRKALKAA
jgi:hypothetical protein